VDLRPSSRPARRAVAAAAALTTAAGLLTALPQTAWAKPTPPPRPAEVTVGDVAAATAARNAMAAQIGQLTAQIAEAKIQVEQAQSRAELAEQRYALALSERQKAEVAARKAQAKLQQAVADVASAHGAFVNYVRASYMGGALDGTAGTLLTATDPSVLLEQSALQQYQEQHKADAVGALQTASVMKSNAEAEAKRTLAARKLAEAREQQRKKEAQAAYVAAQQQKASLEATMAQKQRELEQKQADLVRITSGHRAWLKYKADYAVYKDELARWQQRQAMLEARRKARLARQHHHDNGGGSSGGGWHSGPAAPSRGSWTPAKGQQAVNRALSQLGMPYIWAGGNAYGPTSGGCTDPIAPCGTVGYDCSGLVLYAWGATSWAHYAATQYGQVGRYHPSPGNFRRGDLLFWSGNGTRWGIGHVAIYIGNGNVVQAPQSGDVVKITPWWAVEAGYFGATRPFT
jgi:cell wall-associated NlpC family hydrolase